MRVIAFCISVIFLIIAFVVVTAFDQGCKHIYVSVEPSRVERNCDLVGHPMIPRYPADQFRFPEVGSHSYKHDSTGLAYGIDIVCIKCYHETKQKINYSHK